MVLDWDLHVCTEQMNEHTLRAALIIIDRNSSNLTIMDRNFSTVEIGKD